MPSAAGLDDLDSRRVLVEFKTESCCLIDALSQVVVDWSQHDVSNGSFGVVFSGTWRDDSGVECDVVVKVSARSHLNAADDDLLNETLRYEAEILRQLDFTPNNYSRDRPPHMIKCLFFCNYSSSLHDLYNRDAAFRKNWEAKYDHDLPALCFCNTSNIYRSIEPQPDVFFFLVMPKMHCRNLAVLQRSMKDKHCDAAVGMKEDALWVIAGQLLRTIGFLNKHGFAHLDIKRENIVLDHANTDTEQLALQQLFSPLSCPPPASASSLHCVDLDKIRVRSAAPARASHPTSSQVHLIDFGHATHMLHFSRHIRQSDDNICTLDNHCPKGYSAPEASRAESPEPCLASDLFSLGCCLYMLSCGLYPFDTRKSYDKKDDQRQPRLWDEIQSLKCPSELQDERRFRNNYSTFSTFSREFQDFILMILHPNPAHRIPIGSVEKTPPVVKLFHKFPRLFGSCSDEQTKIAIIENMTPSPTQAVLLQLCECLCSIRCTFGHNFGHGKKRPRPKEMAQVTTDRLNEPLLDVQDDDGAFVDKTVQLLIGLLKNLNKELSDSKGTGTPAIHMYSILDQVAALHVCLDERDGGVCQHAMLQEVDAELILVLENCNDDKKRKRGIVHQICGCAFRRFLWPHRHIISLIKRNLRGDSDVSAICFHLMIEWLRFKYDYPFSNQDVNTQMRMEQMTITHLLCIFECDRLPPAQPRPSVIVDTILHRMKDITGLCGGGASSLVRIDLLQPSKFFDNDCVLQLKAIVGIPDKPGILSQIADACTDTSSHSAAAGEFFKITHTRLIASVDEVLLPLFSLLNMIAAYLGSDPNVDNERRLSVEGLGQELCALCSRLYSYQRKPRQQGHCGKQTVDTARDAMSNMWKHQLQTPHDEPLDLVSHLYSIFTPELPKFFDTFPEIIVSYVCKALTVLSITQHDDCHCSAHLSKTVLSLGKMKAFFQKLVRKWAKTSRSQEMPSHRNHRNDSKTAIDPRNSASAQTSPSNNVFWKNVAQTSGGAGCRVEQFLQHMGPYTVAACFCDCVAMHFELEFTSKLSENWRVTPEFLDCIHLQSLWPTIFNSPLRNPDKPTLLGLISEHKYDDVYQMVAKTPDLQVGWSHELIASIPPLLVRHVEETPFSWDCSADWLRSVQKTIQVTLENAACRGLLLGRSDCSDGRCEHGVKVGKHSEDSKCKICNAQRELHHLLIKFSALIRSHFERIVRSKLSLPVDSEQPQYVQHWFQIVALLSSQHDLFCRSRNLDANMEGIDAVCGQNISFVARKLFELVEVCGMPQLSMGRGICEGDDIKSCILQQLCPGDPALSQQSNPPIHRIFSDSDHLSSMGRHSDVPSSVGSAVSCGSSVSELPAKLSHASRDLITKAVLTELGRLASCSLAHDSSYLTQAEDLHYILGELFGIARDESCERQARERILRKVRAWNVPCNTRGCGLYCSCLCLMMTNRESSQLMFLPSKKLKDPRQDMLEKLQLVLHAIARQSAADHSNKLVQMFISELVIYVCLSSCGNSLLSSSLLAAADENTASVSFLAPLATPTTERSKWLRLPDDSSVELRTLRRICVDDSCSRITGEQLIALETGAEALWSSQLKSARNSIFSILKDKSDGQYVEELQVGYKILENSRKTDKIVPVERLLVERDGWVDQEVLINVWNRKCNVMQEQTLKSFLHFLKPHNKAIYQALIKSAQDVNKALEGEAGAPSEPLNAKDNRLKVAHYLALAEHGALEPGNPKCSWIRKAFDVEAAASQMEENALTELKTAIESFFISSQQKYNIGDELQQRRTAMLRQCLLDIDLSCDDELKCSAAKAAFMECDVIIKMHQQLPKFKVKDPDGKTNEDNRKSSVHKKDRTLHSLLDEVQQQNKPILKALIKVAKGGSVKSETMDAESGRFQHDRLKVAHYLALAEHGALEPGNPKCSWIRKAFDVEAAASQMEENALTELKTAIEARVNHHRRLQKLHECLQDVECHRHDTSMSSAATAAYIECILIIKMHQKLAGDKLLPMVLDRLTLDRIIKNSEYLEERVHDNRRLMRVAIRPKFAQESSDAFWRKVMRLCAADGQIRKDALQAWLPDAGERVAVIKRFSYIFDRHFAVTNARVTKAAQMLPVAATATNVSDETDVVVVADAADASDETNVPVMADAAGSDDTTASNQQLECDDSVVVDDGALSLDSGSFQGTTSAGVGPVSGNKSAATKRPREN